MAGIIDRFREGFNYTDEDKELLSKLEKLRVKEGLGYRTVREFNKLAKEGQYPPILAIRVLRGLRSVVSDLLKLKKDFPEK